MSKNFTVCLVDDDAAVRNAMKLMMKSARVKLITFASAQEYLVGFDSHDVGCIILDIRMPGMTGLELQKILRQRRVDIPVLVLTGHAGVAHAVEALKSGAVDILYKPLNKEALFEGIHKAFKKFSKWQKLELERKEIANRLARLTPRELEILDLMVAGRTNKMIALDLGISRKTGDIHRTKIMHKMKARTVADLVRWRFLDQSGPGGAFTLPSAEYRPRA